MSKRTDKAVEVIIAILLMLAGCLTIYTGLRLAGHPIPYLAVVLVVVGWRVVK